MPKSKKSNKPKTSCFPWSEFALLLYGSGKLCLSKTYPGTYARLILLVFISNDSLYSWNYSLAMSPQAFYRIKNLCFVISRWISTQSCSGALLMGHSWQYAWDHLVRGMTCEAWGPACWTIAPVLHWQLLLTAFSCWKFCIWDHFVTHSAFTRRRFSFFQWVIIKGSVQILEYRYFW